MSRRLQGVLADGKAYCFRDRVSNLETGPWPTVADDRPRCVGPYAQAILRFHIDFPVRYPQRPPSITFSTDIFHPLISPLTTYTYTTQDTGADTISASDDERLPPGGFSLRHGFPQWFMRSDGSQRDVPATDATKLSDDPPRERSPHILHVLYYLRSAFTSEDFLDSVNLAEAANPNAWHAFRSYLAKRDESPVVPQTHENVRDGAETPKSQRPGGAREPGEWNWEGVWEDRVRKCVESSMSEQVLYSKSSAHDGMVSCMAV